MPLVDGGLLIFRSEFYEELDPSPDGECSEETSEAEPPFPAPAELSGPALVWNADWLKNSADLDADHHGVSEKAPVHVAWDFN